jgi:hypothetical protein
MREFMKQVVDRLYLRSCCDWTILFGREAERVAQLVGQRRLAEQAGFFEPVEVGEVVPRATGRPASSQ